MRCPVAVQPAGLAYHTLSDMEIEWDTDSSGHIRTRSGCYGGGGGGVDIEPDANSVRTVGYSPIAHMVIIVVALSAAVSGQLLSAVFGRCHRHLRESRPQVRLASASIPFRLAEPHEHSQTNVAATAPGTSYT